MSQKKGKSMPARGDVVENVPYSVFFEYAKFPMMLVNEETTIVLSNRAFSLLTGYPREKIDGIMSWMNVVASEDQLQKMKEYHVLRRGLPGAAPEEYEFEMIDCDGNRKDINLSVTMIPETKLSLVFLQDITEKKRTEIWYKAVFENTGLPSIIIAPDTTIIKANSEFCFMSGFTQEEIEGKMSWTVFINAEDLARMKEYHLHRRDDERNAPRKYEFRFISKEGTVHYIANSVTMIPGSPYSIASLMDISELREAETERKKLEDQLHQARKLESIGQLAGGIAHDFNNMLAAILGYSQIARIKLDEFNESFEGKGLEIAGISEKMPGIFENVAGNSEGRNFITESILPVIRDFVDTTENYSVQISTINSLIDEVVKAAGHAAGLTRQLLAFARKQTLEVRPLSLNRVINNFEKILRRTIRENVDIKITLHPLLNYIEADVGQIEQIILNLALNAQDAMPSGGILYIKTANVILDKAYAELHDDVIPGRYIMLEISDSGTGMDPEIQSRVFEPFFTTKEQGKGTGLGLATVYGIVRQHMGHIWLYSEQGKGTTFHIYLPQSVRQPEKKHIENPQGRAAGAETILVVEDQDQVRRMISLMLQQQGYYIIEAENAQKGLEVAAAHPGRIHLLVTDVVMPGLNGKELYNELEKLRPDVKVLFISGYPREIISYHGILEEGLNFLQKPVHMDTLTKKIREILDS